MKFLNALSLISAGIVFLKSNSSPTNTSIDATNVVINIVTAAFTAACLIIALMAYVRQRIRREISWTLLSDVRVVRVNLAVRQRIKILFDDKPLSNLDLRLATFRIRNSGDHHILQSDYTDPIKVTFGANAELLDAEILTTTPDNIKRRVEKSFTWDKKEVLLGPFLLNSGDFFDVKVLLAGGYEGIQVEALGIVGIKHIVQREIDPSKMPFKEYVMRKSVVFLFLAVWVGYMMLFYILDYWNEGNTSLYFSNFLSFCAISFIIAVALVLVSFLSSKGRSFIENI